jgi:hypothetical protein
MTRFAAFLVVASATALVAPLSAQTTDDTAQGHGTVAGIGSVDGKGVVRGEGTANGRGLRSTATTTASCAPKRARAASMAKGL